MHSLLVGAKNLYEVNQYDRKQLDQELSYQIDQLPILLIFQHIFHLISLLFIQ